MHHDAKITIPVEGFDTFYIPGVECLKKELLLKFWKNRAIVTVGKGMRQEFPGNERRIFMLITIAILRNTEVVARKKQLQRKRNKTSL